MDLLPRDSWGCVLAGVVGVGWRPGFLEDAFDGACQRCLCLGGVAEISGDHGPIASEDHDFGGGVRVGYPNSMEQVLDGRQEPGPMSLNSPMGFAGGVRVFGGGIDEWTSAKACRAEFLADCSNDEVEQHPGLHVEGCGVVELSPDGLVTFV